jgi:RNA polymerase sigma-70 factor (ECF subfamily)
VESITEERHTAKADPDAGDVALATDGDTVAFERLYRTHVPRIHSLVLRMTNEDAAADLTQDVFIRAWQKLATFQGRSTFGTWLYRVALNVVLAHRSAAGKERSRYLDPENILERVPAKARSTDLKIDFEEAMGTLPGGAKKVFVLHDVEGFKHEEIAEMMEISVGTSKSQLHRARMMLRGQLDR